MTNNLNTNDQNAENGTEAPQGSPYPNNTQNAPQNGSQGTPQNGPEPPMRWNPAQSQENPSEPVVQPQPQGETQNTAYSNPQDPGAKIGVIGKTRFRLSGAEVNEFESARRYITISQVVAIVSLFMGGMLISVIAVVCALVAYSKLDRLAVKRGNEPEAQKALKRSGIIAIAVASIALVLNIISAMFLYPMVMEMMQSGTTGVNLGGATSTGATGGNTTWG